jgi:hypothetical protein
VEAFETEFAAYLGAAHAVGVARGAQHAYLPGVDPPAGGDCRPACRHFCPGVSMGAFFLGDDAIVQSVVSGLLTSSDSSS